MTDSVNLTKGESVSLTKKAPGLVNVAAAAGWDVKANGPTMDLDLAAFLLVNGKVRGKGDFVYFGSKKSACGSVASRGDNLTGEGDGDDETIDVNLSTVPAEITEIVFVASIYDAAKKGQSLKNLDNAFIRMYNKADNAELAKFDISHIDHAGASFTLGKLVRDGADWTFTAIGEPELGDLSHYTAQYGLANAA